MPGSVGGCCGPTPGAAWHGRAVLLAVLVAARLAYHLECGFMTLSLLPWALLMAMLYLRTRSLIAMVCAHAAYDMVVDCATHLTARYGTAADCAPDLAAISAAWLACWYWTRHRTPHSADPTTLPLPA